MAIFPIGPFRKASLGNLPPMPFFDHLELYLDARRLSGADGSNVDPWPDLSAHARNLPANTSGFAGKPTLLTTSTTSPKGAQVVRYNAAAASTGPAHSALFVGQMPDLSAGQTVYVWFNGRVFSGGQESLLFAGGNLVMAAANPNLNPGFQPSGFRGTLGNTEWSRYDGNILPTSGVFSWVFAPPSDGSGRASVFLNGTQLAYFDDAGFGGVPNKWGPGPNAGTNLQILVSDASGINTWPLNGEIGAVLWYSIAHSASQRLAMESWLRGIWG